MSSETDELRQRVVSWAISHQTSRTSRLRESKLIMDDMLEHIAVLEDQRDALITAWRRASIPFLRWEETRKAFERDAPAKGEAWGELFGGSDF